MFPPAVAHYVPVPAPQNPLPPLHLAGGSVSRRRGILLGGSHLERGCPYLHLYLPSEVLLSGNGYIQVHTGYLLGQESLQGFVHAH